MVTQKYYLEADENLRLDFRLQQTVLEGEVVDVFGEAQKMRNLVEPSRVSIDLRTLESIPAFTYCSFNKWKRSRLVSIK